VRSSALISSTATGVRLQLRIQPRASREEIVGVAGDAIRIRLTAPPVEGAANEALVRLLARRLEVARSAVEVISGLTGRDKLVAVEGITAEQAARRLGLGSHL
jgi:uncharacterized protein (TIGR00251 family)